MRPPYSFREYEKRVNFWIRTYRDESALSYKKAGVPERYVRRCYERGTKPGRCASNILEAYEV